MFLASSEFLGSSPHTLLGFFLGSSLQGGVLCILFFLFFCSSIAHLISMAQYLITATALELVFFYNITRVLTFKFWLLSFLHPTEIFFSHLFLHFQVLKFVSFVPKCLYLTPPSIFFMTSLFGGYIPSLFDAIPLVIISVANLLIPNSIFVSSLNYSKCID